MAIAKKVIESIKRSVELKALVEAKGIALKKNGKSYFGLCPFHADKNPSLSVTPSKNLWQCFGCGAAGDVIRFVELFDQVDFKEAVRRLSDNDLQSSPPKRKPVKPEISNMSAKERRLLARVIEFYHTAFCEDPRAKDYLAGRGVADKALFADHRIGFANGTLLNVLPTEGDIYEQLKRLGVVTPKGREHFYGYVTFPLYDLVGNPAGLYGRRIGEMVSGDAADHLYLPGARSGLFNRQAAKAHKDIILTESVIDSLTLMAAGIKNSLPCYGVNGFTPAHLDLLKRHKVESVHICFDADDSGRKAADKVTAAVQAEDIRVYPVTLPQDHDINSFFTSTPKAGEAFKALLNPADPIPAASHAPGVIKEKPAPCTPIDGGFAVGIGPRQYEVRGISRAANKLKAMVKGICTNKGKRRLHPDTVDFYSARSRGWLTKGLCDLFDEEKAVIAEDLQHLMELVETYKPPDTGSDDKAEISEADKKAALGFLKNPDLFDELLEDFETVGYTGEAMNKLLCYLAAISRKMDEPLSVMIQSRSAAGKSFLQDTVLSLIPDPDYVKYTRLTDQALFYKKTDSLKHKILAIEELDGMNGAIYSIRSIQSSRKISIAYTGKDPDTGELTAREHDVEGPLMVFITTTAPEIDGETASRFVFISIDESREMTEKVLAVQRRRHTLAGMLNRLEADRIVKKHKAANHLLKPLRVVNPYAELLTFTSKSLRARRDHTKYLNLILAVAYLFQYQRKHRRMTHDGRVIEYINVTLADIDRANTIANEVLGRSLDELSPPSRELLLLITAMCKAAFKAKGVAAGPYRFNRRRIREFSGWSDFQIRTHIRQLEELEYIYSTVGKRGKEYVYELVYTGGGEDGKPFLIGLTDIETLRKKAQKAGIKDDE